MIVEIPVADLLLNPQEVLKASQHDISWFLQNPELWPPIDIQLVNDGPFRGKYFVWDGAHRCRAAQILGLTVLQARVK